MKRIMIFLPDEIAKKLEENKKRNGVSYAGAVRISLREYFHRRGL